MANNRLTSALALALFLPCYEYFFVQYQSFFRPETAVCRGGTLGFEVSRLTRCVLCVCVCVYVQHFISSCCCCCCMVAACLRHTTKWSYVFLQLVYAFWSCLQLDLLQRVAKRMVEGGGGRLPGTQHIYGQ